MYIYNDEDNVPMNEEAFPQAQLDYTGIISLQDEVYRERVLKHDEYSFRKEEGEEE